MKRADKKTNAKKPHIAVRKAKTEKRAAKTVTKGGEKKETVTAAKKHGKTSFYATVKTSPVDCRPEANRVDFAVPKDVDNMLWDDVIDGAFDAMTETFPKEHYPNADVDRVFVYNTDDEKWYPVVRDGDKGEISRLKKSKECDKFLVLGEARYSLTKEMALYLHLQQQGFLAKDMPYDPEALRAVIEGVKRSCGE